MYITKFSIQSNLFEPSILHDTYAFKSITEKVQTLREIILNTLIRLIDALHPKLEEIDEQAVAIRKLRELFSKKRIKDISYEVLITNLIALANKKIKQNKIFIFLTARLKSTLFNDNHNEVSLYA